VGNVVGFALTVLQRRFDALRESVGALRKLASLQKTEAIEKLDDVVPVLFQDMNSSPDCASHASAIGRSAPGQPSALSTRRVAAQIGYTVGTLYLVFRSYHTVVARLREEQDETRRAMEVQLATIEIGMARLTISVVSIRRRKS